MSSSATFDTWLAGGTLPPITTALADAVWGGLNKADLAELGPGVVLGAVVDAIRSLEAG